MKEQVIVLGAGGHARSVIDILLQMNQYDVVGCISPEYTPGIALEVMESVPLIGTDEDLIDFLSQGIKNIFVAIGDNSLRKVLQQKVVQMGFVPINAISPAAMISRTTRIGKGVCIMAGAVVNVNCTIGDGCIINTNSSLDHDCMIKDYSHIAPGVAVSGTALIGEGVHVGTGTAGIENVKIGEWSYIGAGSVVISDIEEHVLVYGNPARRIKKID